MLHAHEHSASASRDRCGTPGRPSCGCSLRRECSRLIGNDCRYRNLGSRAALFENVIVDCIYGLKGFASYFRAWHTDPKCFFHAHHQLECVDGIQTETVRTKTRK